MKYDNNTTKHKLLLLKKALHSLWLTHSHTNPSSQINRGPKLITRPAQAGYWVTVWPGPLTWAGANPSAILTSTDYTPFPAVTLNFCCLLLHPLSFTKYSVLWCKIFHTVALGMRAGQGFWMSAQETWPICAVGLSVGTLKKQQQQKHDCAKRSVCHSFAEHNIT